MNQRALEAVARALDPDAFAEDEFGCWTSPVAGRKIAKARATVVITAYEAHLKAEGFVVVEASHIDALAKFVMWAMNYGPWDGCGLDGGDVQDKAEELGVIIETKFDPKVHGDRIEAEPGDQWFVPADWLKAMLSAATTGENDASDR